MSILKTKKEKLAEKEIELIKKRNRRRGKEHE
jgi:hypothetical protein